MRASKKVPGVFRDADIQMSNAELTCAMIV